MKIVVGIPPYRCVHYMFLDCFFSLISHLKDRFPQPENQIAYSRSVLTYLSWRRNEIWRAARNFNADYLLTIDSDMLFAPEDFDLLFDAQKDIISSLYFMRQIPTYPCMFVKQGDKYLNVLRYPQEALVCVNAIGFGFCLISKNVIQALDEPFDMGAKVGEDMIFCEKAEKAGFDIWVHTASKVGHMSEEPFVITEKIYQPPISQPVGWPVETAPSDTSCAAISLPPAIETAKVDSPGGPVVTSGAPKLEIVNASPSAPEESQV